jgi:ATP-dependent DNA ligase
MTSPSGNAWLYEFKHDAVIAWKDGERVELYSRPGNEPTYRFPLIVDALPACARAPASFTGGRLRRRPAS